MQNELTPPRQLAYPVQRGSMDENIEKEEKTTAPEGQGVNSEKKETPVVTDEGREKAKNAWAEEVKKREAKGEKITDEQKEIQRQMIEHGILPQVAPQGDGYFEKFPVKKFEKNQSLKDFAIELRKLGENRSVTEDRLKEIALAVSDLEGVGSITADQSQEFIEEMSKARVAKEMNLPYEGEGSAESDKETSKSLIQVNLDLFANSPPLLDLGQRVQRVLDSGSAISPQALGRWSGELEQLIEKGQITTDQKNQFTRELQGIINTQNSENRAGNPRNTERGSNTPKSIQEVCQWIINSEGDEWGPKGPNALLDQTDNLETANFNKANFLKWVRERMLFYDAFSPDDPGVNLLGSVGFETEFRTIGLGTMINNKKQYFKDLKTGEVYDQFSEDIVNEIFLFNQSRNFDAAYRFRMWSDEDLPKFLAEMHQKSIFTSGSQLKTILKLSSDYGTGDTKVGDTLRTGYEVYYHMSDFDKLQEILGENSSFFTRSGFENAYRLWQGKSKDEEIPENYVKLFDSLFKKGKPVKNNFIKFVNVFNETGKKQSTVGLVREAIRLGLSEKYGLENGLEYDPSTESEKKKRSTRRKNLEYAERWAYSMARWTGAGARNDTDAIGYDAQTKAMKFQQYRIRQAKSERGGAFGNEYDLPILKNLTLDFFNGIFVEQDEGEKRNFTPFEIFEKLDDFDNQILAIKKGRQDDDLSQEEKTRIEELAKKKNSEAFDRLKFKQFTELDYASNHLGRSWGIFHRMMGAEELDIDSIVKYEPFRGLVFDRGKFEDQVKEKFIKPIRYAFKTYSNIDYTKKMRVQDLAASKKAEMPVYKEVTVAEAMFGPAVLKDFYKRGTKEVDPNKLKDGKQITKLYKNVARSIMAAHIRAHRERFSGYSKMSREQVNMFYEALESITAVEVGEDEESIEKGERFFSEHDIKWMREYSKTTNSRMFYTDVVPEIAGGAISGAVKGFKDFWGGVFK